VGLLAVTKRLYRASDTPMIIPAIVNVIRDISKTMILPSMTDV
jgi:hypothetical protein